METSEPGRINLIDRKYGIGDIVENRRAEREIKQSENWYRAIFENTGTAMMVVEEDTTIILVNTEFENLTGFSKQETEGKISWTVFPVKEDLERMIRQHHLRRIQPAEALRNYECRFINKDGQMREIHLTIDMIPDTKKSIASLVDITDRRQANETLKESQRKLADIIEFFPDATLVIDKNGNVTAWNRALEDLTGVRAQDMLGRGNYEYAIPFHGYRRPILVDLALDRNRNEKSEKAYETLLTDGGILRGEGLAANLSTGNRYCSATAIALYDSRGEAVAAIECIRDITEQKRIEERLNRAEKMEALGTLAGGVAHDLNNVLGVLVGYSELLMETLPEGSLQKGYAQNILRSSERGAAIIQDLLTMARRGVSVAEVVNLNKVIVDYLDSPEHQKLTSYNQDIRIKTELADDLFNVKGSPIHLNKSIMNLISNAAEAISGTGTITIKTENRYLDYTINGYDHMREGDYVVLSVADTGGGIPEKDLGKIFEPFYTKKVMGRSGTGLGLAVVWGTVKDHHGFIDVKSEEDLGSTFTLYFPVTREELVRKREKSDIAQYMGRNESILVVDDMEFQRELATNLVSKLNYEVIAVSSGEAAIEYLKTRRADLLLLDMLMEPGIDGLETFQRVLEIVPDQRAIIVSGFAEDERVRKAQELGAGEYVRKPYNLEKIGLAIRKELDRR
ncbi:MAG: Blue-light-activated protein [Syntrophus sp. PtaU1.Bin208]|nr:MAG: Blue-light-activated protein [Syntrophus sp. PtaU1.Bin208]